MVLFRFNELRHIGLLALGSLDLSFYNFRYTTAKIPEVQLYLSWQYWIAFKQHIKIKPVSVDLRMVRLGFARALIVVMSTQILSPLGNLAHAATQGYTDHEISPDNVFISAPTVDMELETLDNGQHVFQPAHTAGNFGPGLSVTKNIRVKNVGTLPLLYKINQVFDNLGNSGNDDLIKDTNNGLQVSWRLYDSATVDCMNPGSESQVTLSSYSSSLDDFGVGDDVTGTITTPFSLGTGATSTWCFTLTLPLSSSFITFMEGNIQFHFTAWDGSTPHATPENGFFDVEDDDGLIRLNSAKINELYIHPTDPTKNYLELYNPTNHDVVIDTWTLKYPGLAPDDDFETIPHGPGASTTIIKAREFKMVLPSNSSLTASDFDSQASLIYLTSDKLTQLEPITGAIQMITDRNQGSDCLGWGTNTDCYPTTNAYDLTSLSISRKLMGFSTQVESDFANQVPTPGYDTNQIVMTEVYPDSDNSKEFVEIYNPTHSVINLKGFKIQNNLDSDILTSSDLFIQPGQLMAIVPSGFTGSVNAGTQKIILDNSTIGTGLREDGDQVDLINSFDVIFESISYGDDGDIFIMPAPGVTQSLVRTMMTADTTGTVYVPQKSVDNDLASDWGTSQMPSAGLLPVTINEYLADPAGADNAAMPAGEFIELFNNTGKTIDLSFITDPDNPTVNMYWHFTNSAGQVLNILCENSFNCDIILGANQPLAVYRNGQSNFELNNNGDTISLYNPYGLLFDKVTYTAGEVKPGDDMNNISMSNARLRDAIGNFVDPIPTPGAYNITANQVPAVYQGQLPEETTKISQNDTNQVPLIDAELNISAPTESDSLPPIDKPETNQDVTLPTDKPEVVPEDQTDKPAITEDPAPQLTAPQVVASDSPPAAQTPAEVETPPIESPVLVDQAPVITEQ